MPSGGLDASVNEIQWVKLELDLGGFNPGPFLAPLPAGVRVMTMPELGDGQRRRREIYELKTRSALPTSPSAATSSAGPSTSGSGSTFLGSALTGSCWR